MLNSKFHDHSSGEEDFNGFYHIWAWWPSRSCDLDHLYMSYILSFHLPKEAQHELWV